MRYVSVAFCIIVVLISAGLDLWRHETPWYAIGWALGFVVALGFCCDGDRK